MIKKHIPMIAAAGTVVMVIASYAQFSVDSQGNITAKSLNLLPSCTGFLYSNNGVLSCNPGTVSGGGTSLLGPSVSATNNASQTIPGPGVSFLTYNENEWDTGGIHPLTGDQTQFIVPSAGFYLAFAGYSCHENGVGFQIIFRVNGEDPEGAAASQTTASGNMNSAGFYTTILQLNAGDVVRVGTYSTGQCTTNPYYSTAQFTKLATGF